MHPHPHHYVASAQVRSAGSVIVSAPALRDIQTAPPPEFDGPGGLWSPETLLTAAVADCFILTFRGIARAARFDWIALDCETEGTLERIAGQSRFTRIATTARLTVLPNADMSQARLERGKEGLEIYVMCEIPNNVLLINEFSKLFDGFSIGSNDLTQLTLGVDRDSATVAFDFDERDPGSQRSRRSGSSPPTMSFDAPHRSSRYRCTPSRPLSWPKPEAEASS